MSTRFREPIPRARDPWGWLGGFLTLGLAMAGIVGAALALWENVDIQRLTRVPGDARTVELPDPVPPNLPARGPGAFEVALFGSAAVAGHLPDPEVHAGVLTRWEDLVQGVGGRTRRITTAEEIRALGGAGLVVAPAAVCLDDAEVSALVQHVEGGGGLVLTWATGARDGRCEWKGWGVIQTFTGASDVRELERREALFLTVPAGTPLSWGLDPGTRVELRWDGPLAVETRDARVFWSDWALNAVAAEGTSTVDAAAATRTLPGGGRVAWFGFMEHHAVQERDRDRLRRLLENGVLWAARIPSAEILPWPHGLQSGVILAASLSGDFLRARALAEGARRREIPTTFFAVSSLALAHPELAPALASAGEVATQSSDNAFLAGLPEGEQRTRLRRTIEEIEGWSGRRPDGLRAPEEGADAATLAAWRDLGGGYLLGLNDGRTGAPEVLATEDGPVVLLPRLIKDDYNLLIQERTLRPGDVAGELDAGARKLRALGGLAVVTLHSELALQPRYLDPVLDALQTTLGEGGIWAATGSEVAAWTLARHEAAVRLVRTGPDRWEVEVRAPEDRPLAGAWVAVDLPVEEGWELDVSDAEGSFARSPRGLEIPVGSLLPGETRTLALTRPASGTLEEAPPLLAP